MSDVQIALTCGDYARLMPLTTGEVKPKGITLTAQTPTVVLIEGIDKQKVGHVAAELRAVRPPEPYKGKGIRYQGEQVRRKAGKAGSK